MDLCSQNAFATIILSMLKNALVITSIFLFAIPSFTYAEKVEDVVITEVQIGGAGSSAASQEFVELYNPTDEVVDVTGWRLQKHASESADGCASGWQDRIVNEDQEDKEISGSIQPRGYFLLVTQEYIDAKESAGENLEYNGIFSSALASSGHVRIGYEDVLSGEFIEMDKLGWGEAQCAEGELPAEGPAGGQSLKRFVDEDGDFIDTDINGDDFTLSDTPSPESTQPTDGETDDDESIDDPEEGDEDSNPDEGEENNEEQPPEDEPITYLPVQITELLPDPGSPKTDADDEFIEIYNPNDEPVDLEGYILETGKEFNYGASLPSVTLETGQYIAIYSGDSGLVLANSGGAARISDPDGTVIDQTEYGKSKTDEAWAYIGSGWEFTNRPTPGSANLNNLVIEEDKDNESAESELKPCRADQYRNPETNRCKKKQAATAALKPCAPDQYRNPATNRCKKKESANKLKPCKSDQVRNPATNRCIRKATLASANISDNMTPPESRPTDEPEIKKTKASMAPVALAGGATLLYGMYEFRYDLRNRIRQIRRYLASRGGSG